MTGYGESRGSKAAFMFTWPDGDTTKPPLKMLKVAGAGLAVIDEPVSVFRPICSLC